MYSPMRPLLLMQYLQTTKILPPNSSSVCSGPLVCCDDVPGSLGDGVRDKSQVASIRMTRDGNEKSL